MVEIVVVVEGAADARIATCIAERVIIEQLDWIEPYLQSMIAWTGLLPNTEHTCWKDVGAIIDEAKRQGVRLPKYISRQGYGQEPLKAYGAAARKVLNCVHRLPENRGIRAVLLIVDLDNQPERKAGLVQARLEHDNRQPRVAVVIGTPDRNREAWVLNGFEAQDAAEQRILNQMIADLSFNPCEEAHRLRSTSHEEPERQRNAKIVLEILTGGDQERESHCWETTDLATLRRRGIHTGLSDYIAELETRLPPVLLRT